MAKNKQFENTTISPEVVVVATDYRPTSLGENFADPPEAEPGRLRQFGRFLRQKATNAWRLTKKVTHTGLKWVLGGGKLITGSAGLAASVLVITATFEPNMYLLAAPITGILGALIVTYRPRNNEKVEKRMETANFWWDHGIEVSEQTGLYFLYGMPLALWITAYEITLPVIIILPISSFGAALATELAEHYITHKENPNLPVKVTGKVLLALKSGASNSSTMEMLGKHNAGLVDDKWILVSAGAFTVLGGINQFTEYRSKKLKEVGDAIFEGIKTVGRASFFLANTQALIAVYNHENVPLAELLTQSALLFGLYVLPGWYAVGKYYSQRIEKLALDQAAANNPPTEITALLETAQTIQENPVLHELFDDTFEPHDIRKITWRPPVRLVQCFGIFSQTTPEDHAQPPARLTTTAGENIIVPTVTLREATSEVPTKPHSPRLFSRTSDEENDIVVPITDQGEYETEIVLPGTDPANSQESRSPATVDFKWE